MRNLFGWAILAEVVVLLAANSAVAAISGLELTASGLSHPLFATHAPGDPDHLYVAERSGNIKIVDLTTKTVTGTFLSISGVDTGGEGGFLGLAFHPEYANPDAEYGYGKFYTYTTVDLGEMDNDPPFASRIREYEVDDNNPNQADPSSLKEVLSFVQPQENHNGGWIGFSPVDNYLYIASGDGGGGNDTGSGHTSGTGNAQDRSNNLLGKMLRIDVNGDDFTDDTPEDDARNYAIPSTNPYVAGPGDPLNDRDDEIWLYGLRNPYRDSFDRITGDLWVGDVGQGQVEEVDVIPAEGGPNRNLGWRLREGSLPTGGGVGGAVPADHLPPIYEYTRPAAAGDDALQGEAITGGYRYRGPDPDLQGMYFFGDSDFQRIWSIDVPESLATSGPVTIYNASNLGSLYTSINRVVSFAEDANGNIYVVDLGSSSNTGEIYRLVTNNALDGDYNVDGHVDAADYTVWRNNFGTNFPNADGDGSGTVNEPDYTIWKEHYGDSVHELGGGSGGVSGVPEPATIAIIGTLLPLWLLNPRRRGKL